MPLRAGELEGRFPRHLGEVPQAALDYLAGGGAPRDLADVVVMLGLRAIMLDLQVSDRTQRLVGRG